MYLGAMSLSLLRAFLDGFIHGCPKLLDHPYGFIDFHHWVALRLRYFESTSGYVNMILEAEGGDEEKGIERFFALWHEFRSRRSRTVYEADWGGESFLVSQRRLDTGEVEEMRSNLIQLIKYTEDDSGFIKFVNGDKIIEERYVSEFDKVFWWVNAYGFKIDEGAWRKVDE